jgi:hypothetical protein
LFGVRGRDRVGVLHLPAKLDQFVTGQLARNRGHRRADDYRND